MPQYYAFGLHIHSTLDFPDLLLLEAARADVCITLGSVSPTGLLQPTYTGLYYQTAPGHFWLHVPDIAWFHVTDGRRMVVTPAAGADAHSIRLYVLGSCMGALLHQRGLLVLHGTAIRVGAHGVIFAGPLGYGKSTLAAAFHQRQYEIVTDDLCAISAVGHVMPSYPRISLWHDTATHLGIDTARLQRSRLQVEKYAYPLRETFCQHSLPVAAVYILSISNRETVRFEPITGMDMFTPLKNNTYRMPYLQDLGLQRDHLQHCGRLAGQIQLTRINQWC